MCRRLAYCIATRVSSWLCVPCTVAALWLSRRGVRRRGARVTLRGGRLRPFFGGSALWKIRHFTDSQGSLTLGFEELLGPS